MNTCLNPYKLRGLPFVAHSDRFLLSGWYLGLLCAVTLLCNAFAWEFAAYGIFAATAIFVCLFGPDLLALMPIVVCCYIAPNIKNNPGAFSHSVFYTHSWYFLLLAGLIFSAILFRLLADRELNFWKTKRKLLPGFLALGAAFLLAGAFSGEYFSHGSANLVFALTQFAALFLLYFLFTGAVRWEQAPKDYLGRVGLYLGMTLMTEVVIMYILTSPFGKGSLDRNVLFTGWGNYNCMGGLLCMMIPFAFHMAALRKPSWLYTLCGIAMLLGVIMTCSRTSIICGLVIYFASFGGLCLRSRNRRSSVILNVGIFGGILVYMVLFQWDILMEYLEIFTIHRSVGSRFDGFVAGIRQFFKYPIFGGSFFAPDYALEEWSKVEAFTSFFPGLFHNTIIQVAASCGLVGLAAYLWHRLQTVLLIVKKPSTGNLFIGLSIAAMLMASLFDCHIFNIGPALFYSMSLAYAEKSRQ